MTPNAGGDDGGGGGMKKGPWSAAEDAILTEYVKKNGEGNWNAVQRNTVLWRCGKSCRLRWANHLRPNLKKGAFSVEEERMIIELHSKLGNKWARISAHLPGRTDNEIKNYWNTRMKRRLRHGLPLYPHDLHHFPLSPPPAPPLPCRKNPPENPLCIFNPISLSYPTPLFSLHAPPILSSPPYPKSKRISHLGQPQLPSINSFQLNPVSFSLSSVPILETEMGFGLELDRDGGGSGFRSDSELPSNQFYQKDATSEDMEDVLVKDNPNVNVGRSNSGLLDALLQEAQDKVRAKGSKRERDDFGTQWDEQSSSENSFGLKKEECEEYHSNAMNEDLSSLLDLIPSLVHVPEWCNDGREPSIGQSSVVTDDNYVPEPQPPCFPEEDWNSGCYSWDNLPRIC